jgi:hypothetical protein
MPEITYYRFWCKKCEKYSLHLKNQSQEWKCKCGKISEPYFLSEVPDELILEQRERYKKQKRDEVFNILHSFEPENPFSSEFPIRIIETDAGQKEIDDERNKEIEERSENRRQMIENLTSEYHDFKHLGRNDTCACGSGKKYKRCCLSKFEPLINKKL